MKKLSALAIIVGAALLAAAPVSIHWPPKRARSCHLIAPTPE
jgi:hypothetical protein